MSSQIQRQSPAYRMVLEMILIIIFHFMNSKPVQHARGSRSLTHKPWVPDARKRRRIQSKRHHQYTHTTTAKKCCVPAARNFLPSTDDDDRERVRGRSRRSTSCAELSWPKQEKKSWSLPERDRTKLERERRAFAQLEVGAFGFVVFALGGEIAAQVSCGCVVQGFFFGYAYVEMSVL